MNFKEHPYEVGLNGVVGKNQQHTASGTIKRMTQGVTKISDSPPVEEGDKT